MSYRTYWDENGDETVELEEGPFSLPPSYRAREVANAFNNMLLGADRRDMPVSRATLHLAVQEYRRLTPGFGIEFRRDPRRFSSTPAPKA